MYNSVASLVEIHEEIRELLDKLHKQVYVHTK